MSRGRRIQAQGEPTAETQAAVRAERMARWLRMPLICWRYSLLERRSRTNTEPTATSPEVYKSVSVRPAPHLQAASLTPTGASRQRTRC
jgi:hypothetical protein